MTDHGIAMGNVDTAGRAPRTRLTPRTRSLLIWAGMLTIVVFEVRATYIRPSMPLLIGTLLALAVLQAALGLIFFMHLRRERAILGWSMVGSLVFVLLLMNQIWPDARRVFSLRLPGQP